MKNLLLLPVKPLSVNAAWQGRRFKTKAYKQYCQEIAVHLPKNVVKIGGLVDVKYRFFLRNWKLTDGDNLVKCLQDILVSNGFIDDDRYIMRFTVEKYPSKIDRIEVEIDPHWETK